MAAAGEVGCRLTVAFFEVYRGQVLDLLNQHSRLEVLEDDSYSAPGRSRGEARSEEGLASRVEMLKVIALASVAVLMAPVLFRFAVDTMAPPSSARRFERRGVHHAQLF